MIPMSINPRRMCAGLFVLLAGAHLATAVSAQELPTRQAGAWEMKTSMDEGQGPRTSEITMCIDADMERNTVVASVLEHRQNCARYDIKRGDGEVIVEADCTFNRARVTSTTRMSGDFKSAFAVKIESATIPPDTRMSQPIKRTIEQSGRYLGTDCGDLQPGEAKGTDGRKVLVQ